MTLTPARLDALKNQHGLDADEAQELFAHIDGLEEQNRHDDDADTEMRRLLCEENDALRARAAELEEVVKDLTKDLRDRPVIRVDSRPL